MIKPGVEKTFAGHAEKSFFPLIKAQLRHADGVDIVCDEYIENSLKAITKSHRGTGVRRRVTPNSSPGRRLNSLDVDQTAPPELELLPSRGFQQARALYVSGRLRELP